MLEKLKKKSEIPAKELREWFDYSPETGELFWKKSPATQIKVGMKAGYKGAKGYYRVKIKGQLYLLHRVIWALHNGEWPKECLDHVNGDKSDNRISNLREATWTENRRNGSQRGGKSQYTGVTWHNQTKKWMARFRGEGDQVFLGLFSCEKEAAKAYNKAAKNVYGDFAGLNHV